MILALLLRRIQCNANGELKFIFARRITCRLYAVKDTCFSKHSRGGADSCHFLSCRRKFLYLCCQPLIGRKIIRSRKSARKHYHLTCVKISIFDQEVTLHQYCMRPRDIDIYCYGNRAYIDAGAPEIIYYRDRFNFFKSFRKKNIYHMLFLPAV